MKKWIGAICSAVASVLTFIFLAIPAFVVKEEAFGLTAKTKYSGYKLLTNKDVGDWDYTAVTWYRIFAWVLIILAVVLLVLAVLQILSNLGVVKMPEVVGKVNAYTLIAFAVVAVLALVAVFGIRAEIFDELGISAKEAKDLGFTVAVSVSLWLTSICAVIAAVVNEVLPRALKK